MISFDGYDRQGISLAEQYKQSAVAYQLLAKSFEKKQRLEDKIELLKIMMEAIREASSVTQKRINKSNAIH